MNRMSKEELARFFASKDSTVLSFEERGPYGDSSYNGNWSGYIPGFFMWKLGAKNVSEIFAGSGSTSDIAKDMGVNYIGIDINPNPKRQDILSMNILDDSIELPKEFYDADICFLHPPYPSINNVRYAGKMYQANDEIFSQDIQNMSWEKGMNAVNHAILRGYNSLPRGSYEVVMVGEIRSKGCYKSMFQQLAIPGELFQTYVKIQHNTMSGRNGINYGTNPRALTAHEMIAVIKKASGFELAYVIPKEYCLDLRDTNMATWIDVVSTAVGQCNKTFGNEDIYHLLQGHKKCSTNSNYKAKVRQKLQELEHIGVIHDAGRGFWTKAA